MDHIRLRLNKASIKPVQLEVPLAAALPGCTAWAGQYAQRCGPIAGDRPQTRRSGPAVVSRVGKRNCEFFRDETKK